MVDGKVVQVLTGNASSLSCTVCNEKQSQLNEFHSGGGGGGAGASAGLENNLEFRISSLHARIRFMEYVLKIAYDLSFKDKNKNNPENIKKRAEEKLRIQNEFRKQTGLVIDTPKQGFGNTNDGKTARRFFEDSLLTSKITQVDYELIRRFKVILNALSSIREIDANKFEKYTNDTADIYIERYGTWRKMSSTVHKVLRNGSSNHSLSYLAL